MNGPELPTPAVGPLDGANVLVTDGRADRSLIRTWGPVRLVRLLMVALLGAGCTLGAADASVPPWRPQSDPMILAVGDIVTCGDDAHERTLDIVERYPEAVVATLGDTVYEEGSPEQFEDCYEPSWGRVKDRTRPTVGGHEYLTPNAAGYFDYFGDILAPYGAAAVDPARGWYSYALGDWHVVVLNSWCKAPALTCERGSPQLTWLDEDLTAAAATAAPTAGCTLALVHTPRFSSGRKADSDGLEPMWEVLYRNGVEMVLSGDNHAYERLEPQTPTGQPDPSGGIRQFVVGTGGRELYPFTEGPIQANSAARNDQVFGVLKLVLRPDGYDWEFLPVAGERFTDSGSARCHQLS